MRWSNAAESRRQQLFKPLHYPSVPGHIAEFDLIHIDVPPPALLLVHNLDMRRPALHISHRPHRRQQLLVVFARSRTDHFPVHDQPNLCIAIMTAPDQEAYELALNRERLANEPPRRIVPAQDNY